MGVPVLEGADLGKRFGGLTVLSGVSFRVADWPSASCSSPS